MPLNPTKLVSDVQTLLPLLEKVFGDVRADVSDPKNLLNLQADQQDVADIQAAIVAVKATIADV
jgi:hypothetical protein